MRKARAWFAWRLASAARRIHPEPLVVMLSSDTVKRIPDGYELTVPGTDIPLARVSAGTVNDARPRRG